MITLIAAMAHTSVIGADNDIPWKLPADMKHFRALTSGGTVVMGRRTYESILTGLGGPLPNRRNIVVTRDPDWQPQAGFEVVRSLDEGLTLNDDIWVIGGANIYLQAIDRADCLEITEIDLDVVGDTYFPPIDVAVWQEVAREHHEKDDKNRYDYDFVTYRKRS